MKGYLKIESIGKPEQTEALVEVAAAREEQQDGGGGGARLSRTRSVSSSGQPMKGAVSMRRSSSVSERYRRIHDQSSTSTRPFSFQGEDAEYAEDAEEEQRSGNKLEEKKKKKKDKRGKFLKACKRFFGLS